MKTLAKLVAIVAACLLAATPSRATVLKPFNLEELVANANRIFSGTVTHAEPGSIAVGGGTLPIVTYRLLIDNGFRGERTGAVAEFRMLTRQKATRVGPLMRYPLLADMPELEVGKRYLLFVTRPSTVGLSTTVGLGQGFFHLTGEAGNEQAVNAFDNEGLFRGMTLPDLPRRGPVKYRLLAKRIGDVVARKK
jgi:hypothetical protein